MTDLYDTAVESDQVGGRDDAAQAHVVGKCVNRGHVRGTALITDRNGRASISMPDGKGRSRLNEGPAMGRTFETEAYRNELNLGDMFDTQSFESAVPIAGQWRWLYEIETSAGPMIVKIPMFDGQVQQFIAACTSGAK